MKSSEATSYKLIERPIYGSSRVGIDTRQGVAGNTQLELIGYTAPTSGILTNVLGLKQYEFSNHLGNVLTTVSDKKIPVDVGNDGTIDYYMADITSASDYYPFGSPLDGRTFSSDKYRFGFNGQEKDDEVKGEGNSLDFGARIYDSRLGRWLGCDPLAVKYPNLSPYNYCANNPIKFVDYDGKDYGVVVDNASHTMIVVANIYTTDNKTFNQACNGVSEINSIVKTVSVDGVDYTLSFQIKVIPPIIKKESFIRDGVEYQIQDNPAVNANNAADIDPIGNTYNGLQGYSLPEKNHFTGEITTEGGRTNGKKVNMLGLPIYDEHGFTGTYFDCGKSADQVCHEFLHLLGLGDVGGSFYSEDGKMNYVGTTSNGYKLNPISTKDIQNILDYARTYGNDTDKVNNDQHAKVITNDDTLQSAGTVTVK
ncbi:MAG: RHS repeat-associated core domain-containing protein [Bacteroidota bacterium]